MAPHLRFGVRGPSKDVRDWDSYVHKQKYWECQLVSALNAWTYLTGKRVVQNSKGYEALVDLCGARHGSAFKIEKIHRRLGIEPFNEGRSVMFGVELPAEISVWHKCYGFHSVLAVEWEPRTMSYRIPNFDRVTNTAGWVFAEDLNQLVSRGQMPKDEWSVRSFRLAGHRNGKR